MMAASEFHGVGSGRHGQGYRNLGRAPAEHVGYMTYLTGWRQAGGMSPGGGEARGKAKTLDVELKSAHLALAASPEG